MPKKKIAISISDLVFEGADEYAALAGVSRSSVIQEAAADYVTSLRSRAEREHCLAGANAAFEDMPRFADERAKDPACADGPSSLEVLRSLRGRSHAR